MSPHQRARFQIHRLDDPRAADDHYRAFWRLGGQTFRIHVWSPAQWERVPEAERPDQRPEYFSPVPVSSQ